MSIPASEGIVEVRDGFAANGAGSSPDASLSVLRAAIEENATALEVELVEACLENGLGFRGPYERFGELTHALIVDALWCARRDGAQFATEAASKHAASLEEALAAARLAIEKLKAERGVVVALVQQEIERATKANIRADDTERRSKFYRIRAEGAEQARDEVRTAHTALSDLSRAGIEG